MKRDNRRLTAQVQGWVPTGEGLDPLADAGLHDGFLTLVGDRNPAVQPIHADLADRPGSPWGGMSGAGVVVGDVLIGVVRSHNLAAGGQSLTVTPLTAIDLLPADLRQRFRDALGIAARAGLRMVRSGVAGDFPAPALSPDVREACRPTFVSALAPYGFPVSWTLDELSELQRKAELGGLGDGKAAVLLNALCEALTAKAVFAQMGGNQLELSQLQVIYQREIRAWPDGNSADALLVEAASVDIAERRSHAAVTLRALTRFMVGVAATLGSPVDDAPFARWVEDKAGHSVADAQAHYSQRQDDPSWLVIDLGDEPRPGAPPWPDAVSWMLLTGDEVIMGDSVSCVPTADGVRRAIADVLRCAQALPGRSLLVDLAVPRALMDEGIEHWPVVHVDDADEPLSAWHSPRLRWARRRRDARLYNRLIDRLGQASWHGDARQWMKSEPRRACFIGGREAQAAEDPLRVFLREGGGFAIWFPAGLRSLALREVGKAVRKVPTGARRGVLPDHLPRFTEAPPAVIWDDPKWVAP